jgi:hypothetical protein
MDWRLYRGVATLSKILAQSILALETALQAPDSNGAVRTVLDGLLYKALAEARTVLPHLLTYSAAVFDGVQHAAPVDPSHGANVSQHGAHHQLRSCSRGPLGLSRLELLL